MAARRTRSSRTGYTALDIQVHDQDKPADNSLVPNTMPGSCRIEDTRHGNYGSDDQQNQADQSVFGDDAGIRTHRPYGVCIHASRESHRSTSIHAQAIQQSFRMLRTGPYRVDDVTGAISGKHRPRMGEQSAYRVKTLVDSHEERSGCRPASAQSQSHTQR